MSDLMREEFEAWFLANAPKLSEKASWLDPDAMAIRRLARHAWQASRECLVIDMPKPAGLDRMSSEMSIQEIREDNRFDRALDLVKKALTAAGVKYQ